MKNKSIQKPTTLIKITKSNNMTATKKDVMLAQTKVFKVDFENDFENINNLGYLNIENDESIFQPLELHPFKCEDNKNNISSYTRKQVKLPVESEMDFFLLNLKFDLRVKKWDVEIQHIFVYFYCVIDAISFYKQYFNHLNLSFQEYCDWSFFPIDHCLEISSNILHVQEQKVNNYLPVQEKSVVYCKERFHKTVNYFNNLKSTFCKAELQKLAEDLSKGNTDFAFLYSKELSVGSKSNKIMQDAIKIMSGKEISMLYEHLEYDISAISASKHGAYTIQTLLNYSTDTSHKKQISKYFKKEGQYLFSHEIGNYTFQKLLAFDEKLVWDSFIINLEDVVHSDLGLKVFKKCAAYLAPIKESLSYLLEDYAELDCENIVQLRIIVSSL